MPATHHSLQVMTYNTWGLPFPLAFSPRRARLPRIGRFLEAAGVDIVGLQEVWSGAPRLLGLDNLRMGGRTAGDSGLAIWSRWPVERLTEEPFRASRGVDGFKRKGVLVARVDVEHAGPVSVLVTHLQAGRGEGNARVRALQVDQVLEHIATTDGPLILMGDFNFDREAPTDRASIRDLAAAGLVDAAEHAGTPGATYPRHGRRYDRVLLRGGPERPMHIDEALVVQEAAPLSDHLPLRVRLRLSAAARDGAKRHTTLRHSVDMRHGGAGRHASEVQPVLGDLAPTAGPAGTAPAQLAE